MLRPAWLSVPRRGALNMHGSLLPKYRGRAPVHWAILKGESATGASLHYMVEKPDAGALVDQAIRAHSGERHGARRVAQGGRGGRAGAAAQSAATGGRQRRSARRSIWRKGSYFGRRRPEDGRIDWRRGARQIHDLVRAVAPPFPGAFTEVNGCRLAVLETRVDAQPARYDAQAPCLYAADGEWFADCIDGRRLQDLAARDERRGLDARRRAAGLGAPALALV